ncbi:hypothetical protein AWB69_03910 [Caballeronia udeis]|uniref:Uncharacterized protein n=1 Tax=Caballeronia udeis TaxID=1232866 RepID=A0A158H541_9BURK|nr:hypothetical protein AWB69_03910 [Caballeronia udeis]
MVAHIAQSGCFRAGSGVLLGPEIPLVVDSFLSDATLVMVAVRRHARRRAVLPGWIMGRRQGAWIGRIGWSSNVGRDHFGWIGPRLTLR